MVPTSTERLTLLDSAVPHQESWWSAYEERLRASGLSDTSRRVIESDAKYIVEQGVLGADIPGGGGWPPTRIRTGAVVGSVQSGKTASMLAVAALAMDRGVDAVILLAGTRTALWLQTVGRVTNQLDVLPDQGTRRYLLPFPGNGLDGVPDLDVAYSLTPGQARRAAENRRPVIAVVMKNVAHLGRMAKTLEESLYPALARQGRDMHLLVIDDEADDSSITDGEFPGSDPHQVPRRIRDLWDLREEGGETAFPWLHATYVAYTATPQANFLQDASNPLAPRDFFITLRTPGAQGTVESRSASYRVPEGLAGFYTGGDVFYKHLSKIPLCVPIVPGDSHLQTSLRAFLVACAVRCLQAEVRLGPLSARDADFGSADEASSAVVPPMSMLVHSSQSKDAHFALAERILAWASGPMMAPDPVGRVDLPYQGLLHDLQLNEPEWSRWLDNYDHAQQIVVRRYGAGSRATGLPQWHDVRRMLETEVLPGTRLAVVNSDENAADRPRFTPELRGDRWIVPPDLCTIFVAGNVMSRGLTLEGLTTTYFSRSSESPAADTQMQMQRWFGYRGAYIHLCRVFLTPEQLALFHRYNEADSALRLDLLRAMEHRQNLRPPLSVLQGREFVATAKVAALRANPLWPGPTPIIRLINPIDQHDENVDVVRGVFSDRALLTVGSSSSVRGVLLEEHLSALEAANLLDSLRYVEHGPGGDRSATARWASVHNHLELDPGDPRYPLYRPPTVPSHTRDLGSSSPYWIAAYLRMWVAATERRVPGMRTTHHSAQDWSLLDLPAKARQLPDFSVGVRFGSGDPLPDFPSDGVTARMMDRALEDDALRDRWGSRGGAPHGAPGDAVFDLMARGLSLDGLRGATRPPGSDGLILFFLLQRADGTPGIAVGLNIPVGGPDNIAAWTKEQR